MFSLMSRCGYLTRSKCPRRASYMVQEATSTDWLDVGPICDYHAHKLISPKVPKRPTYDYYWAMPLLKPTDTFPWQGKQRRVLTVNAYSRWLRTNTVERDLWKALRQVAGTLHNATTTRRALKQAKKTIDAALEKVER